MKRLAPHGWTDDMPQDPLRQSPAASPPRGDIWSASFLALLVTQLLGALNDNMFRWLVIGICKDYVSPEDAPVVLSAGLACFVTPYLFLAVPAGYLADRYSKRQVIVGCKIAEIFIMALGIAAVLLCNQLENVYALFVIVFLMGSQSALFSPAKLGSIPEIVAPEKISAANGMLGLTTVVSTVVGFAAGMYLSEFTGYRGLDHLWVSATALIGVAVLGWLSSLRIGRLIAASPQIKFPWRAARQTWRDLHSLIANRAMFRVAMGIALFWTLGSLVQMNIDQFGFEGGMDQTQIVPLLVAMVFGVGLGSVLAGIWSGGKVELGILPLGAGIITISALMLFTVRGELVTSDDHWTAMHVWACLWLFTLGLGAGLFDVPLTAYMQHRSPHKTRGKILAASNFITFCGMLGTAAVFAYLKPLYSARTIFLFSGLLTLPVFFYVIWLLPQATVRFCVWLASHTVYRVTIHGREHLPESGGALLAANHVTGMDGVFLLVASSRPVRLVVHRNYAAGWPLRLLARMMHVIWIDDGPKAIRSALQAVRQAVAEGELVCMFPEGQKTRSGALQPFRSGLLSVVGGTETAVIPVYLGGLWGSIFSYRNREAYRQERLSQGVRRWRYPVSIHFGPPITAVTSTEQVRAAVASLSEKTAQETIALEEPRQPMNLPVAFLKRCRRCGGRSKIADLGTELSGRNLLIRTLILRRLLLRNVLADDERYVGLLLPPSVGGAMANAVVPLCGRVPVNLNYTLSSDVINHCIAETGIRHVLTSRKLLEKQNLKIDAELVYLEDFKDKVTLADKTIAALQGVVMPIGLLARHLGVHDLKDEDVFTIIFTSGSTGEPKGVMLTLGNIGSNVMAIDSVVHLHKDDVLLGILPFFHVFGYTGTLWTVLTLPPKGIYHFSPLKAREIGKLCGRHKATIILATPTFLRGLLQRCEVEQFAAVDVLVTGAERLPGELADAFEKKFGIRPIEGYGTTELSPLSALNIPPSRARDNPGEGVREGTIGRPIPGVDAKVVHLDTLEDLPPGSEGMLLFRGPNVMKGYLNNPEKTAEVIRDGWYVTGDIAKIDADGFIQITGRESRFSKIGGEMVPHLRIEDAILEMSGAGVDEEGDIEVAVSAVPDTKKGERIVVLYKHLAKSPEEICRGLQESSLPPLWVPSAENFMKVDSIPVLGTGKLDLKAVKELARCQFPEK